MYLRPFIGTSYFTVLITIGNRGPPCFWEVQPIDFFDRRTARWWKPVPSKKRRCKKQEVFTKQLGVSKNRGTWKWMVYNGKHMENPIKTDDLGCFPPIFGNTQLKTKTPSPWTRGGLLVKKIRLWRLFFSYLLKKLKSLHFWYQHFMVGTCWQKHIMFHSYLVRFQRPRWPFFRKSRHDLVGVS